MIYSCLKDDDELDTSYEGLWRLSEQIGYERERGLSSEARKKLKIITWRQHSLLKHQHVASKTTSKGKEKAKQTTQTVEQRYVVLHTRHSIRF